MLQLLTCRTCSNAPALWLNNEVIQRNASAENQKGQMSGHIIAIGLTIGPLMLAVSSTKGKGFLVILNLSLSLSYSPLLPPTLALSFFLSLSLFLSPFLFLSFSLYPSLLLSPSLFFSLIIIVFSP